MWILFLVLLLPLVTGTVFMTILILWLIFKILRGRRRKPLASYPRAGIMVPHYNEKPAELLRALDAIEKQHYPSKLTVLLADDGSTNGIQEHLQLWLAVPRKHEYISIRYEQNHGRKGKVMDAALPHLPEDIEALVVVDSDTFLEEHSVRLVIERLWQNDKCAAVCGYVVPANPKNSFLEKLQYFEHIGVYPAVKCAQDAFGVVAIMCGAFVVHRMSAVREVGGWNRWLVEDIAWTWSALGHGYKTGYAPEAIAYTNCPTTHHGLFKQRRRWARGRVEAFRALWQVSPLKGVLAIPMFCNWLLSLLPPTLCLMPVLAIVFQQWWVFGLIGLSFVLYVLMFSLYQVQLPAKLRKSLGDIMRSTYYNTVFELVLWRPTTLGFFDEAFGKSKTWMTR